MLAQRDELEMVGQFLKGDKETKSFLFDEMIGLTSSLLSQLKVVLASGTKEEKKQILKKIKLIRHAMQMHYQNMKAKINVSDEELNLIIQYLIAKSPAYREKISHVKHELDAHKDDLSKLVSSKRSKIKSIKTKSKWIRS